MELHINYVRINHVQHVYIYQLLPFCDPCMSFVDIIFFGYFAILFDK